MFHGEDRSTVISAWQSEKGVGYEPGGSPFANGRALFATVLVGSTNAHSKVGVTHT